MSEKSHGLETYGRASLREKKKRTNRFLHLFDFVERGFHSSLGNYGHEIVQW